MQKRACFVILLVAFSGLLFPPMSFAQNTDSDTRPLKCPDFFEYEGDIYTMYDEHHSGSTTGWGDRWQTFCRYSADISEEKRIQFHTYWFTETSDIGLDRYDGICSGGNVYEHSGNSVHYKSQVVFAGVDVSFPSDPAKRTMAIDKNAAFLLNQVYDQATSCPSPKGTIDNIALDDTEEPVPQKDGCGEMPNDVTAKIVGLIGDVRVLRDGEWFKATRGMDIHTCDVVKTANDGRARIEFDDLDLAENAGPSVVNLGSNTEVAIQSFAVRFEDGEVNQKGFLELLHGTIRAFARGWGSDALFTVEVGVALCGIRGSDMVFSYDPQQEKLSVFANEGEVSVKSETAGNTKMVTAGQSVIMEKGHINPVSQMSDFVWQSAVSQTILPETEQATAQELGETQLNEPMDEISPLQDSGGGCLVATATYGSELSPQVQQLRELRDSKLLQTESGTGFIESFNAFYYSFSPYIADYERENPVFKETVKLFITPLIASLSLLNYVDMDSEVEVLGYGISLIILNLGMYVGIPALAIISMRKRF